MADNPFSGANGRQWRLVTALFAGVVLVLAVAYAWFLKADYAVLASNVRPEEAAAIVEELKAGDVPFTLENGGTTILVPEATLGQARLGLASKELPIKGTVGFELFNKSDMGLTDFAQKVNYQRALQGEITRTLMGIEGIASARVHIALPERSLFRTARSEPRAAVTITPAGGTSMDADRVAGIQRLVAATIPDLDVDRVAVLNGRGQLLTPQFSDVAAGDPNAIERNYADRVRAAITEVRPGLHFDLKVSAVPRASATVSPSAAGTSGPDPVIPREHQVRIIMFTRAPLAPSDEQAIRQAVTAALQLDAASGDELLFSRTPEMAAPMSYPEIQPDLASAGQGDSEAIADRILSNWLVVMAGLGVLAGGILLLRARRQRLLHRDGLVLRIREQLRLAGTDGA